MIITPDTLAALKVRMGAELATLQAAMIASPKWSTADNNAFGPTAQLVLSFVASPFHYASLAADYNDGISRREDMLAWWRKLAMVDPGAPPVPGEIKQSSGTPDSPVTSLGEALKTGAIIVGIAVGGILLLQVLRR